jgi:hypothetical protein
MYAYYELSSAGSKTHIMLKIRPVGQGISPFFALEKHEYFGQYPWLIRDTVKPVTQSVSKREISNHTRAFPRVLAACKSLI